MTEIDAILAAARRTRLNARQADAAADAAMRYVAAKNALDWRRHFAASADKGREREAAALVEDILDGGDYQADALVALPRVSHAQRKGGNPTEIWDAAMEVSVRNIPF